MIFYYFNYYHYFIILFIYHIYFFCCVSIKIFSSSLLNLLLIWLNQCLFTPLLISRQRIWGLIYFNPSFIYNIIGIIRPHHEKIWPYAKIWIKWKEISNVHWKQNYSSSYEVSSSFRHFTDSGVLLTYIWPNGNSWILFLSFPFLYRLVWIIFRICQVLRYWLETFYDEDFENSDILTLRFRDFVEKKVAVDFEDQGPALLKLLASKVSLFPALLISTKNGIKKLKRDIKKK